MRFFSQLIDRVPPMQKFPFIAVDICYFAVAAGCGGKSRIIGKDTRVCIEFANVYHIRPCGG